MNNLNIDIDEIFEWARKINPSLECMAELFSWSTNFDNQEPFVFFLNATGITEELEDLGVYLKTFDMNEAHKHLGMYELDLLGNCFKLYATHPSKVFEFMEMLYGTFYEPNYCAHCGEMGCKL
jgi:hypothetical protein